MKAISENEARHLILCGVAGYWAIHHRVALIPHEEQTVVRLRNQCWLCTAEEIRVEEPIGVLGQIAGRLKGAFPVNLNNPPPELIQMIEQEMSEKGVRMSGNVKETPDPEE